MTLTVATYNIHRSIGTDGREDVGRIAAVIEELDADILAIQEAEARPSRTGGNQAEELARRLNMELIEGPLLFEGNGHYGNALLSRLPLQPLRRHRFPRMGREARGFIHAEGLVEGQPWHVIATHLDLSGRARSAQLNQLAGELMHAPYPSLLMGDLNEWRKWTRALASLRSVGTLLPPLPSFPSRYPVFPLDRIIVRGARVLDGPSVHRTALSRRASDHLPVRARLTAGGT